MHPGAQIDQSLRSFDQGRQNVGREHIDCKDARNSGLHFHPPLAITDARIVDYSIEAAELVDLVGNCFGPAIVERSPETTPPAPVAAARASRLRLSFRPCNTTSWPWSIRSRAAMRPRPSDDPVMNTRATLTPPYELERSSCAPRVSLHSVRGTTQRSAFYASGKFGLDILERRVTGELTLGPSRLIPRARQAVIWSRPQQTTSFAYGLLCHVGCVA